MQSDHEQTLVVQTNLVDGVASEFDEREFETWIIQNIETIVSATDISPAIRRDLISYHVTVKYNEFVQRGFARDIEETVEKQSLVIALTDPNDKGLSEHLDRLGVLLELTYERTGEMADLQMAIEKAEQAVNTTPELGWTEQPGQPARESV